MYRNVEKHCILKGRRKVENSRKVVKVEENRNRWKVFKEKIQTNLETKNT
jgi:hypothetical protein